MSLLREIKALWMSSDSEKYQDREIERLEISLKHARELFIYHAGQRIASIRYYFVASSFLIAGFGTLISSTQDHVLKAIVGITLGMAGAYLTHLFSRLDERNAYLVRCDEEILRDTEKKLELLATQTRFCISALTSNYPEHKKYKVLIPRVFGIFMALYLVFALLAVGPAVVDMVAVGRGKC